MKQTRRIGGLLAIAMATASLPAQSAGNRSTDLEERIRVLESELAATRAELAAAEASSAEAPAPELTESAPPDKIEIGPFSIGGAIRANYVLGDYPETGAPSRGGDGGNFELDTFRINVGLAYEQIVGALEYRWYNGYNFLHTGWIGYDFADAGTVQVGVNRVPFGPGAYGISQSWFFDQHYYVGLSDDMDLGIKYTDTFGELTVDAAYYISGEGSYLGASEESARYSYDVVNEYGGGFNELHQFNLRAIRTFETGEVSHDIGLSGQIGILDSDGSQDDGIGYAGSIHSVSSFANFKLALQLTRYVYDIDPSDDLGTDDLITMGAYDFAWPVAAEGTIPAVSLSYYLETSQIPWLDYLLPYVEYSVIIKDGDTGASGSGTSAIATPGAFNDSELFVIGSAWARGGWFIYTDLAFSNGNYFVGGDDFTTFGDNPDNEWQTRFNINFGYYF